MPELSIIGPAYETVTQVSSQQLINWYLEALPSKRYDQSPAGLPVYILRPTPGVLTDAFCTTSGSVNRKGILYNDILYNIVDNTFYEIDSTGTETSRGTLSSSSGDVKLVAANDQILITDGVEGYLYVPSTHSFNIITSDGFPDAPIDCFYLDGYFGVLTGTDKRFYLSGLNDATTWDGLDAFQANGAKDKIITCKTNGSEVWHFGEFGIEPWYLSGASDTPIERRPGVTINVGIAAKNSVAVSGQTYIWLARDIHGQAIVVQSNSYIPTVISSDAISQAIENYTTISDAIAYVHRVGVHEFYVLSFPTENVTWVYDVTTQQWHQRTSYNNGLYDYNRWSYYIFAYGKHLLGDSRSGNLYEYDPDTYTEAGNIIKRVRRSAPLKQDGKLTNVSNFILEVEPGVGLVSGQGSDPQIMLRVSRDGGHTWGNVMYRSLHIQGEYKARVKWDLLGSARAWVFELSVTDPVNAVLISAHADISTGSH